MRSLSAGEAVAAVLDVIYPFDARSNMRFPIFEWGHEETPTGDEMVNLAQRIVAAIERAGVDE